MSSAAHLIGVKIDGRSDGPGPQPSVPSAAKAVVAAILWAAVSFAIFAGGTVLSGRSMAAMLGPSFEPAEHSLRSNTSTFLHFELSNVANASAAFIVGGGARTLQARRLSTEIDPPPSGFSDYCQSTTPQGFRIPILSTYTVGCITLPSYDFVASIAINNAGNCNLYVTFCAGNDLSTCSGVGATTNLVSSGAISNLPCPSAASFCGWDITSGLSSCSGIQITNKITRRLNAGPITAIVIYSFLQIWWIVCLLHWCGCIDAQCVEKVWCFPFCCCYPCCCKDRYEVRRKKKIMNMMSQAAMAANPVHNLANAYAAQNNSIAVSLPGSTTLQPQPLQQPQQQQSVQQTHQQPANSLTAPWPSPGGFDASTRIASFR